jgi:hypothetical protein
VIVKHRLVVVRFVAASWLLCRATFRASPAPVVSFLRASCRLPSQASVSPANEVSCGAKQMMVSFIQLQLHNIIPAGG